MASNDYDIVNIALVRLGANTISSLAESTRNAVAANKVWANARDEVLEAHPWNFATRRAWLDEVEENVLSITDVTQADPGVVTYSGTDPNDGDKYEIEDVGGMTDINDETFVIQNVDSDNDTFELMDEDTSGYDAYTSGGTATQQLPKSDNWTYLYALPSNCLRVLDVNDNPDIAYEITELGMLCSEDDVAIRYIKQVTTVTTYSATFVSVLAAKLAAELAIPITGSKKKADIWVTLYERLLSRARLLDAQELQEDPIDENPYADARR